MLSIKGGEESTVCRKQKRKKDPKYAWCLCVERMRSQLSGISDETVRCGGHKNLNEFYDVLQSCYRRGAAWTDYMDVIKFVYLRPVTQEELALSSLNRRRRREAWRLLSRGEGTGRTQGVGCGSLAISSGFTCRGIALKLAKLSCSSLKVVRK